MTDKQETWRALLKNAEGCLHQAMEKFIQERDFSSQLIETRTIKKMITKLLESYEDLA